METPEALAEVVQQSESRLLEIDKDLQPLLSEQQQLLRRVELAKELMATYARPLESNPIIGDRGDRPPTNRPRGSIHEEVVGHVREILSDFGQPMHINQIWEEFQKRSYFVPGAGRSANIGAHLSRTSDVVSTGRRGYYSLPESLKDDPPEHNPPGDRAYVTNTTASAAKDSYLK